MPSRPAKTAIARLASTGECSILLVENKSTAHLGESESEITRTVEEQLEGYR